MRTITLSTFGSLNMTDFCQIPLLPTILALRDVWIHVGSSYYSNNVSNVEMSINNLFSIITILSIPNIYLDNRHVWLGRNLDNGWFWCKDNIVENVVIFENTFDILRSDICVWFINKVQNAYYFELRLGLGKPRRSNAVIIGWEWVLDIFFNFMEIRV